MKKEKEMRALACKVCQIVGGSQCDIDQADCGILPEMAEELDKELMRLAKQFLSHPVPGEIK